MKKLKKLLTLALVSVLVSNQSPLVSANCVNEVSESVLSNKEIIKIARDALSCENGDFPEAFSLSLCKRLAEIDPSLAENVYAHVEEIAYPIRSELSGDTQAENSIYSDETPRNGIYIRDGDGGYFVYEEPNESNESTPIDTSNQITDETANPNGIGDYGAIPNPKNSSLTSTICKIVVEKNGYVYYGTGFFVSNTVVATAAHMLYDDCWEGDFSSGWVDDGGYIIQAYAPTQSVTSPYGRKYIVHEQMRVGASWQTIGGKDNDWGAFMIEGNLQGSYNYRPKRQIDVNNFIGKSVTTYGYPYDQNTGTVYSLFYNHGKAASTPDTESTYRCLFATDTSGNSATGFLDGMSGGPVMDSNGYIVGIFTGVSPDSSGKYFARAVSLDSWLYKVLKEYE